MEKKNKVNEEMAKSMVRFVIFLKQNAVDVTLDEVKGSLKWMTNFAKFLVYEQQNKAIIYDLQTSVNQTPTTTSGKALLQHERSGKRITQREVVLAHIQEFPGQTREEISNNTKIKLSSLTPRVSELIKSGVIIEAGEELSEAGMKVGTLFPAFKQ